MIPKVSPNARNPAGKSNVLAMFRAHTADARGPGLLILDEQPGSWTARQIFDDPAGDPDWGFSATVDLAASDEAGVAVITVSSVGQL